MPTIDETTINVTALLAAEDGQRGACRQVRAHVVHVEQLLHARRSIWSMLP